ncbi:MAG: glutathione S-transferase N-terminal domain-containing protein [Pseudomonadales bacterium]|nr:glutathione S-transferase N-terminal domain-containing protein [Pseudomonadales bacterium]
MATESTLKLMIFPPSPWSEKARWALDVAGLGYQLIEHVPMVSNLRARQLAGNFNPLRKFSLPIAACGAQVMDDSYSIASYAADHNKNANVDLFPQDKLTEIQYWNDLSNRMMNILRKRALPAMKTNQTLLESNLPPLVPEALRPHLTSVSKMAISYIDRKYPLSEEDTEQVVIEGFETLRKALNQADGDYLLGEFSYADIAMAVTLQPVKPVADKYIPLDSGTRECWTDDMLIEQFPDLIEWRDRIYQHHRSA